MRYPYKITVYTLVLIRSLLTTKCPKIVTKFIEIHGTELKCEKEVKRLGITIDEKLRFDTNINNLCKKSCNADKCNVSI